MRERRRVDYHIMNGPVAMVVLIGNAAILWLPAGVAGVPGLTPGPSMGTSLWTTSTEGGTGNGNETLPSILTSTTMVPPMFKSKYSVFQMILIAWVASCLSLFTVLGNILVMVSFKIDKQLQTISNYFLFSLAVADFVIGLVSMPLFSIYTVMGYWPFGPRVCDTWLALDYLVSNASVLNLLIISFDRYFSVTRPLTYR
jgi:muscarinic acetylcholine receptor M3